MSDSGHPGLRPRRIDKNGIPVFSEKLKRPNVTACQVFGHDEQRWSRDGLYDLTIYRCRRCGAKTERYEP